MNKRNLLLILLTIVAVLSTSGCEYTDEQLKHEEERKELPDYTDFKTFTFRGHDYIWFSSSGWRESVDSKIGGVVHDPDCRKCRGIQVEDEVEVSEYERIFGRKGE